MPDLAVRIVRADACVDRCVVAWPVGRLFRRVVWVATGSGIGPVLPHLIAQEQPAHLIWSTRSPRDTCGDMLVDEVVAADPNSLIWDTDDRGRRELVSSLESRGIAAYGALWDF